MSAILLLLALIFYSNVGFFIAVFNFIPNGPSQFFKLSIGQKIFTVIVGGPAIIFVLIIYAVVFKLGDYLTEIFNSLK